MTAVETETLTARGWALSLTAALALLVGRLGSSLFSLLPWHLAPLGFLVGLFAFPFLWATEKGRSLWSWTEDLDRRRGQAARLVAVASACGLVANDQGLAVVEVAPVPGGWSLVVEVPVGLTVSRVASLSEALAAGLNVRAVQVEPDRELAHRCRVVVMTGDPLADGVEWEPLLGRIGVTPSGPALWNPDTQPHVLVVGPTGSGKTTAQLGLVATLAQDPAASFLFVDVKRTGWSQFRGVTRSVVATTHGEALERLEDVHVELLRRLRVLESARADHRRELRGREQFGPLFVVVDEVTSLLAEDLPGEDQKAGKDRARTTRAILANVARLGRQASVHLVLGAQRPDQSLLGGGEFRDNVTARLALGALSVSGREMVFGPEWRNLEMPGTTGRGYWQGQCADPLTPYPVAVPMCEARRVAAKLEGSR